LILKRSILYFTLFINDFEEKKKSTFFLKNKKLF
jgi:hypothetical protein